MSESPSEPNQRHTSDSGENTSLAWSFRGYRMNVEEFSTALTDFYRGEIERANVWRTRLDSTTNWAVLTAAATIFITFYSPDVHFSIILLCTFLITFCLWIEARRYRYYELWSYRVRLMETDFFAAMLVPPFAPSPEWAESLAESLLQPNFSISLWEALGRRLRRNYTWLFLLLGATWLLKLYLYPSPAQGFEVFASRAAIGHIPGWITLTAGLVFNGLMLLFGLATAGLRHASGEVLPKFGNLSAIGDLFHETGDHEIAASLRSGLRPMRRRQQILNFIVTSKPERIARRIIDEMKRGVTGLHGQGMYTHAEREVLLVAVMVTEMARLKSIVQEEDPNAFLITTQAQSIFGRGFNPLGL